MRDGVAGRGNAVAWRAGAAISLLMLLGCESSSGSGDPGPPPVERTEPTPPASPDPGQWQSKRTEFVEGCVAGAGPGVDPQVADDACSCVFDEVSRRWEPAEFVARREEINRELMTRGILRRCRTQAQSRHAPAPSR
jgi:hypothetical protein